MHIRIIFYCQIFTSRRHCSSFEYFQELLRVKFFGCTEIGLYNRACLNLSASNKLESVVGATSFLNFKKLE